MSGTLDVGGVSVVVRPLESEAEARACATIMATSEPWRTLRRDFESCLSAVRDATREVYVACADGDVIGLLIIQMRGLLVGYIQSIAVREDWRGRGVGSRLIEFAEQRIFGESPNVFICVSSFNHRARALYERLGYEPVGELQDFIVRGHSEWLMRKTIGPLHDNASAFRAPPLPPSAS